MAGAERGQQWPPRSPYEALLSSPTGRSRIRRYQDRPSPSPSRLKKAVIDSGTYPMKDSIKARALHLPEEGDDDDEDEETLQLRLQALEAKLKLKKLRQKKNKDAANSSDAENERPSKSTAPTRSNGTGRPDEKERVILGKAFSSASVARPVQVPASPPRKHTATEPPKSPGRVLLGIDKGLKGKNVSLRRPPVMKNGHQDLDDPFLEDTLRHKGTSQQSTSYLSSSRQQGSMPKPKGFSERIASIRQHDKDQTERVKKLQAQKSTGFGLVKEELERMKTVAEEEARLKVASRERSSAKPVFSRDEVLKAAKQPNGGLIHRSNPDDKVVTRRKGYNNPNASPGFVKPSKPREKAPSASPPPAKASSTINKKSTSTDDSLFEPFSSLHLSKRLIPHDSLTKALSGKSILLLPDVLGTVKAPEYCWGDDLEADVVVLATIASKSNPLSHKDAHKTVDKASTDEPKSSLTEAAESETNVRGKYLALTLTDLKWTLDLYLFTTAFTRFRKLTPGTVVAILNPSIMPPPPHNPHNNRFSLTLSSSDDTILEIGTSRDLNWCSAVKKDGKHCGDWIDKRHTSVCEFHVDRVLERTRRGRMEVNGMSVPFAPGGKKGGRTGFWGGGKGKINSREANTKSYEDRGGRGGGANVVRDGRQYDRFNKTTYYVGGPAPAGVFGQSAASLLDGDALNERGGREERMRKRLAEREREKEIARSLGERGNGMGGEYLKIRHENPSSEHGVTMAVQGATTGREEVREPMDAKALGLKGNKGADVLLSPLKKRRRVKDGMEDGPRRKKTRFVTEGGIKEAGRESLGVVGGERYDGAEDNDELDIV